jgi:hypothetical protein
LALGGGGEVAPEWLAADGEHAFEWAQVACVCGAEGIFDEVIPWDYRGIAAGHEVVGGLRTAGLPAAAGFPCFEP